MPLNNADNSYISARNPVLEEGRNVFTRSWYVFLELVARKIRILDGTTTTNATAGAADPLPSNPVGYMTVILPNGTPVKVPYYNE